MIASADFGWIVFVVFLFWVLQMLRPRTRGQSRPGGPPPRRSGTRPDATQREGAELDQLLRQLERRLGTAPPRPGPARPASPAPVARPRVAPAASKRAVVVSAEDTPVDRAQEIERIERERLAEAAARNREISDADYAAFEARVREDAQPTRAPQVAHLTTGQLRDAFLWREILGAPKAFEE